MRHIGILGGSYNPGHLGHRHIAEEAHTHLGLDEVWLWVSHNIFKDPADYASAEDREDLCNMMCNEFPWLKVTTMEKDFHDTMTATSMTILAALHPQTQFTWIFGDDNFATFHNWNREMFHVGDKIVPDWQYIMDKFPIAIMYRPGYRDEAKNSVAAKYGAGLQVDNPADLGKNKNGWTFVDNPAMTISSTAIKEAIARREHGIEGLHPQVEDAIYNRGLFGTGDQLPANEFRTNNKVNFQTFLLLAAAAHAVKSAARYNFSAPDLSTYTDYFSDCYDSVTTDEPPTKLANCLDSLHALANHQGIDLGGINNSKNTGDLQDKILDHLKTLAAICVSENIEKDRAVNLMTIAFSAPDLLDPATAHRNNLTAIENYSAEMGFDLSAVPQITPQTNEPAPQHQKPEIK